MSSWASIAAKEPQKKESKVEDKLPMLVLKPKPKVIEKKNVSNLSKDKLVKEDIKTNKNTLFKKNIKNKPIHNEDNSTQESQEPNEDEYESYIDVDGWNHLTKRYER